RLGDVAVARHRPTDGRALHILGASGAVARAVLGDVAHASRRAALGRARLEAVGRAVVADAVAALGHVAVARRGPADRSALRIGGARRAVARTVVGQIADAGGGPTLDRRGLEAVHGTLVAHPVAALGDVALPGRRPADRRAL